MFVRESKYNALLMEAARIELKYTNLLLDYQFLLRKWNALVDKVNSRGGEKIFEQTSSSKSQFTQEELKKLIFLRHPDKHNGSTSAVELTQKLLKLRK